MLGVFHLYQRYVAPHLKFATANNTVFVNDDKTKTTVELIRQVVVKHGRWHDEQDEKVRRIGREVDMLSSSWYREIMKDARELVDDEMEDKMSEVDELLDEKWEKLEEAGVARMKAMLATATTESQAQSQRTDLRLEAKVKNVEDEVRRLVAKVLGKAEKVDLKRIDDTQSSLGRRLSTLEGAQQADQKDRLRDTLDLVLKYSNLSGMVETAMRNQSAFAVANEAHNQAEREFRRRLTRLESPLRVRQVTVSNLGYIASAMPGTGDDAKVQELSRKAEVLDKRLQGLEAALGDNDLESFKGAFLYAGDKFRQYDDQLARLGCMSKQFDAELELAALKKSTDDEMRLYRACVQKELADQRSSAEKVLNDYRTKAEEETKAHAERCSALEKTVAELSEMLGVLSAPRVEQHIVTRLESLEARQPPPSSIVSELESEGMVEDTPFPTIQVHPAPGLDVLMEEDSEDDCEMEDVLIGGAQTGQSKLEPPQQQVTMSISTSVFSPSANSPQPPPYTPLHLQPPSSTSGAHGFSMRPAKPEPISPSFAPDKPRPAANFDFNTPLPIIFKPAQNWSLAPTPPAGQPATMGRAESGLITSAANADSSAANNLDDPDDFYMDLASPAASAVPATPTGGGPSPAKSTPGSGRKKSPASCFIQRKPSPATPNSKPPVGVSSSPASNTAVGQSSFQIPGLSGSKPRQPHTSKPLRSSPLSSVVTHDVAESPSAINIFTTSGDTTSGDDKAPTSRGNSADEDGPGSSGPSDTGLQEPAVFGGGQVSETPAPMVVDVVEDREEEKRAESVPAPTLSGGRHMIKPRGLAKRLTAAQVEEIRRKDQASGGAPPSITPSPASFGFGTHNIPASRATEPRTPEDPSDAWAPGAPTPLPTLSFFSARYFDNWRAEFTSLSHLTRIASEEFSLSSAGDVDEFVREVRRCEEMRSNETLFEDAGFPPTMQSFTKKEMEKCILVYREDVFLHALHNVSSDDLDEELLEDVRSNFGMDMDMFFEDNPPDSY